MKELQEAIDHMPYRGIMRPRFPDGRDGRTTTGRRGHEKAPLQAEGLELFSAALS